MWSETQLESEAARSKWFLQAVKGDKFILLRTSQRRLAEPRDGDEDEMDSMQYLLLGDSCA